MSPIKENLSRVKNQWLVACIFFIQQHPTLFQWGVRLIQKLGLYNVIYSMYQKLLEENVAARNKIKLTDLTQSAHLIYLDLKAAIAKNEQELH